MKTKTNTKQLQFKKKNLVELNKKDMQEIYGGTSHLSTVLPLSAFTIF